MMLKYRTKFSGQKCDSRLHIKSRIYPCSSSGVSSAQMRWDSGLKTSSSGKLHHEKSGLQPLQSGECWQGFFCIYSYCSILGCHKPGFHIVLKIGRVVILFHVLNISKRPLSGKTVWPWKVELEGSTWRLGSWVIFNGIPSKLGLWIWGCCILEKPSLLCIICPVVLLSG